MGTFNLIKRSDLKIMSNLELAFYDYSRYSLISFPGSQVAAIKLNLTLIRKWIERDCGGEVIAIIFPNDKRIGSFDFYFEYKTDAMAFKLEWQ